MRCLSTEANLRVRFTLYFIAEIILHGKDFVKFNIKRRYTCIHLLVSYDVRVFNNPTIVSTVIENNLQTF